MENTVILKCTCISDFQDRQYGKGMRVHNVSQVKGKKGNKAYCTVCTPRSNDKAVTNVPKNPAFGLMSSVNARGVRIGKSI